MTIIHDDSGRTTPDQELIENLRAGDSSAMEELYRRHIHDARRLARIICRRADPEEVVAEAFTRVFAKFGANAGPSENFRAYLHTAIRHLNIDQVRRSEREHVASDQPWLFDRSDEAADRTLDEIEQTHAAAALRSLPDAWREILWLLEVEGKKPAEIADQKGVSASRISAMAYRAREGLRRAYLHEHLPSASNARCRWVRDRLSAHVRDGLSPRATARIDDHLATCADCEAFHTKLDRLNTRLGAAWWPLALAGFATVGLPMGVGPPDAGPHESAGGHPSPDPPDGSSPGGVSPNIASRLLTQPGAAAGAAVATAIVVASAAWGLSAIGSDDDSAAAEPSVSSAPSTAKDGRLGEDPPVEDAIADDEPARDTIADTDLADQTLQPEVASPEPQVAVVRHREAPPTTRQPDGGSPPEPVDPGPIDPGPVDPEPVDLGLGTPTITATSEPFGWLATFPIMAEASGTSESFTIELSLMMNTLTGFAELISTDWDCQGIEFPPDPNIPFFFTERTCSIQYQPGDPVPALELRLISIPTPTGSVEISGTGNDDPDTSDNSVTF